MIAQAKIIAALAGLLLLSGAANLLQIQRHAVAVAQCAANRAAEIEIARVQGIAQANQESADRAAALAVMERVDTADLLGRLDEIAARAQQTRTVFRDRIREIPAPDCAPGAERMDAANELLRGAE